MLPARIRLEYCRGVSSDGGNRVTQFFKYIHGEYIIDICYR